MNACVRMATVLRICVKNFFIYQKWNQKMGGPDFQESTLKNIQKWAQ